jgi:hypothetical protein
VKGNDQRNSQTFIKERHQDTGRERATQLRRRLFRTHERIRIANVDSFYIATAKIKNAI